MFAQSLNPITSLDIQDAVVIKGPMEELPQETVTAEGSQAPSYYKRIFQLENPQLIYSHKSGITLPESIQFVGYTLLSPLTRLKDTLSPRLDLDNQTFFDEPSAEKTQEVLLIIGGNEVRNRIMGIPENPSVLGDSFQGLATRAFWLRGNNRNLAQNFKYLLGLSSEEPSFQNLDHPSISHPLVFVDALRIAIKKANYPAAISLAKFLIHPSHAQSVKITTLKSLSDLLSQAPSDSEYPAQLLQLLVAGYERERNYPLDKSYMEAFSQLLPNLNSPGLKEKLEGITRDYSLDELIEAREKLAKELKK